MGIYDFYFNWLKRQLNFAEVFQQSFNNVSSLSLDFNSIIHQIAQLVYGYGNAFNDKYGKVEGPIKKQARQQFIQQLSDQQLEEEFQTAIGTKILELVRIVGPRDYLFIAVDGTAPQAKVAQKRSRRFQAGKSSMSVDSTDTLAPVESFGVNPLASVVSRFDTNAISPGTEFMIRLDQYLLNFIERHINQLAKTVYYSSHLNPGEGEHKIIDYFRQNKINGDGMHVIYGMDSDWVMLCTALNKPNLYLWREDSKDVLSIDRLKFQLVKKMGGSINAPDDFVLLFYLFGNDFLPRAPAITTENLDNLINIYNALYKDYGLTYVVRQDNQIKIDWNKFLYFIYNLAQNEAGFFELQLNAAERYLKRDSLDYATHDEFGNPIKFDLGRFRDFWYHHEFAPRGVNSGSGSIPGGNSPDPFTVTPNLIESMSGKYLEGINWIFNYYFIGYKSINLKWYYPYYHAPLFYDVITYLSSHPADASGIPAGLSNFKSPIHNSFLNVYQELLATLPPSSIELIPVKLRWLMLSIASPIIDFYPVDFIVDYELKDKLYKGIPILPFVDPERLIKTMNMYQVFTLEEVAAVMYPKEITRIRDNRMEELICEQREFKEELREGREYRGTRGRGGRGRGRGDRERGRGRGRGDGTRGQSDRAQGPIEVPVINPTGGVYQTQSNVNFSLEQL